MKNILLIEPEYYCKYPPLGLMKISYYHKEVRGDFVWFSKGMVKEKIDDSVISKLIHSKYYSDKYKENSIEIIEYANEVIRKKKWDRVYISTLFTYEWEKTVNTIEYAKTLVEDINDVYVGGILATLMPEELYKETGIKNIMTGQLLDSAGIGYDDKIDIDKLTPDYSILDNTSYEYPVSDAYFTYTTRGCGMNCDFCAVKTLEPEYEPYISIKQQIETINEKYGIKKDLLLMDNNVLKSSKFRNIIEEIKRIGFEKGATYVNPKTGKSRARYVDFNQGLDAYLLTEKKTELLGQISIRPARIAFDHIEDREVYEKAIKISVENDITYLSNYILYNGENFTGKGKEYKADTPKDLYDRLRLNVDFIENINKTRKTQGQELIKIFSFPMRYRPLNNKKRGNNVANDGSTDNVDFVGLNWNVKYLRAIQRILLPTQGKGVSSKSFFEAAFGKTSEDFLLTIIMPEQYIATRGEPDKIKGINEEERELKKKEFNIWEKLRNEWKRLYFELDDKQRDNFEKLIGPNEFTVEKLINIKNNVIRKLYIHYFSYYAILNLLEELEIQMEDDITQEVISYITTECDVLFEQIAKYLIETTQNTRTVSFYFKYFGRQGIEKIIDIWINSNFQNNRALELLEGIQTLEIDIFYLYIVKWCSRYDLLSQCEKELIISAVRDRRNEEVKNILHSKIEMVFKAIEEEKDYLQTESDIKQMYNELRNDLTKQISMFHR